MGKSRMSACVVSPAHPSPTLEIGCNRALAYKKEPQVTIHSMGFEIIDDYEQQEKQVNNRFSREIRPSNTQVSYTEVSTPFKMIEGERLVARVFENVTELNTHITNGTVYITNGWLYFYHDQVATCNTKTKIGLWGIYSVQCSQTQNQNQPNCINIVCKTSRRISFQFSSEQDAAEFFERINELCLLRSVQNCFAFSYKEKIQSDVDGWNLFSWQDEFRRLKLNPKLWKIFKQSQKFELCSSYPQQIIVPSSISKSDLFKVAQFRSKGRVIALTWHDATNNVSICRSSQPMTGVIGWSRCVQDERYVETIRTFGESKKLTIVDCRSRTNAVANQARSGGTENIQNYNQCDIVFLGIDNIHAVREAFRFAHQTSGDYHSVWLEQLWSILHGADIVAKLVESGVSVLIHCSDGWDRTAQISALSQLLLDPYFRTFTGFQVLIEKEWLSFGHKFMDRISHGQCDFWNHEQSPVFLQFMDCVHQLLSQAPNAFEFTEKFLITIMENVYDCTFGTFLFNCVRERNQEKLAERTPSLWSYLNQSSIRGQFINRFYNPSAKAIVPQDVMNLRSWNHFTRHRGLVDHTNHLESLQDEYLQTKQQMEELTSKLAAYEKLLTQDGRWVVSASGRKQWVVDVVERPIPFNIIDDYHMNCSYSPNSTSERHDQVASPPSPNFDPEIDSNSCLMSSGDDEVAEQYEQSQTWANFLTSWNWNKK